MILPTAFLAALALLGDASGTCGSCSPADKKHVVAYFPEWGIYGRQYYVKDMERYCGVLTDVVYSFVGNDAYGNVSFHDRDAAIGNAYTQPGTYIGEPDSW